jgi:DNA replication protein DnaC
MNKDFIRSACLNNVPSKKVKERLLITETDPDFAKQSIKTSAITRFAESNIPVEYWDLKMDSNFTGFPGLLTKYNEYSADLKLAYTTGASFCLAGQHGVGKTMTVCCILKAAALKGYSCLYTTLTDIVASVTQAPNEDKYLARRELCMVDFLVIDEFDSRFLSSANAADLYARSLEGVFRTRIQNKLPTLMCTNSPNIVESFHDELKASLSSLVTGYLPILPVIGTDHRKSK